MAPRTRVTTVELEQPVLTEGDTVATDVIEGTAVAVVTPASTALAKPAAPYAAGRGKEEIDEDDVYLARMGVAQLTSPQLLDGPDFVEGLRAGMFFNGVTKEVYGKGPIRFVIVKMTKRAGVFDAKGKLTERDVKWNDDRCEWPVDADGEAIVDEKGERVKPAADRIYDFLIVRLVDNKPYEGLGLSLKRTSFKSGKQLNSLMNTSPGDAWSFVYEVTAFAASSNGFNYFVPKFVRKDKASDEVVAFAASLYERGARVQEDREADDAPQSGRGRVDDGVPF